MKKKLSILLFLLSTSVLAQDFNKEKIDSLFQQIEDHNLSMGSVAIHQDGKKVYTRAFGYKDVELRTKPNQHTKYKIGSISKTYTAALILQLADEGKLKLDDKLAAYFDEMPNAEKITIENLLNHRSGLTNYTNASDYLEWLEEPKTKEELLALFKENGSDFEPGEKFSYSNTNYALLAFIAEKVEEKDFNVIFDERIRKKLQLKESRAGGKIQSKKNEAFSYEYKDKKWKKSTQTDMSIPIGAGNIASTPAEVNQFFYVLFNEDFIEESSLKKMKDLKDGYGYGLLQYHYRDKNTYAHSGGIDGFNSMSIYFPEEQTNFTIALNGNRFELKKLIDSALDIYFGYSLDLNGLNPVKNAKQYTGTYSSDDFPMDIAVYEENGFLSAQATGQSAFFLTPVKNHIFEFKDADITIEFSPEKESLEITQNGTTNELFIETTEPLENAKQYTGTYTSNDFPLDLKIKYKDDALYGQASGQPEFKLKKIGEHQFNFPAAGVEMKFKPEENKIEFSQNGMQFELKKKD